MIHYLQLNFPTDINELKKELHQLQSREWPLHYQTLHYEGEWSALSLRSTNGRSDNPIISPDGSATYRDTELLEQCPYINELLSRIHCPIEAVRLLKLTPGSVIKEHTDADLCFEKGAIRLHIPITTNPGVEFLVDGEPLRMAEGECWYCNFNRPHALANRGITDRIHLVIDALVNDWVKDLFNGNKVLVKKEAEDRISTDPHTTKEIIYHLRALNTPAANLLADEMEARLTRQTDPGN